ncbi:LPS assembly lipoprotein LptE [Microbulbifer sp. Q7]|uniref:LPS assembly lipoprotein LptE n=1 Tax=Microbulbifer sp. Q7 TaxID=1785091 RepID=UPI000829ADD7|nr:LPS assembly lipoprotein LptE [Microbulbifer sp. Q7]
MRTFKLRGLMFAGLLGMSLSTQATAQMWGGDEHIPSLVIAPTEIDIDVPMPISSGNLELMLAQASRGGGLAELKQQAVRSYTQHLHSELARELQQYLEDEEVPLVARDGVLSLHKSLNLKVIKHLSAMKPKGDYDLEQGNVRLTGEFRYTLKNQQGTALREQGVNIDELKIEQKYRVRSYHDGRAANDNTEEAIREALSELVEELVEAMEDTLEADELQEMASL